MPRTGAIDSTSTKNARLELRLADGDKELYQRAADQDGRPLSNWIRDRLLKAARAELGEEGAGIQTRGRTASSSSRKNR